MARIKIKDLPKEQNISKDDMKGVIGGDMIDSMHEINRAFSPK